MLFYTFNCFSNVFFFNSNPFFIQVVMVGDDLRGDVEGAEGAGLRGVLVRTGKFRGEWEGSGATIARDLAGAVESICGAKQGWKEKENK